jgi:hypothetical protein
MGARFVRAAPNDVVHAHWGPGGKHDDDGASRFDLGAFLSACLGRCRVDRGRHLIGQARCNFASRSGPYSAE